MADDRGRLFARPEAPHRVHDLLLVASYAAGDATGSDREVAEALVAACDECAALVIDLQAVQRAVTTAPAPERTRDFRLTRADADRLQPHGMRGLVAAFTHPRLERAKPVAAGLTMLGLTGLLMTSLSFGTGASPAAPAGADAGSPGVFQLEVASGAGGDTTPAPEFGDTGIAGGGSQAAPTQAAAPAASAAARTREAPGVDLAAPAPASVQLVIGLASALVAVAGLALYLVARRQRRRYR